MFQNERRLKGYGTILEVLGDGLAQFMTVEEYLGALDALADLMTEHAEQRRRHQAEMTDLERDARQSGRESYDTGYQDGTQTARGGG